MYNIQHETIINNSKEIADKYQELISYFMQGSGSMIPRSLIDSDKNRIIASLMVEQFWANPEKFCQLNIEYIDKLREFTANSFAKFVGSPAKAVFSPDNRDKRFKDSSWEDEQYELSNDLKQRLEFATKYVIDAFSPSNFAFCNPKVLRETMRKRLAKFSTRARKFLKGYKKFR